MPECQLIVEGEEMMMIVVIIISCALWVQQFIHYRLLKAELRNQSQRLEKLAKSYDAGLTMNNGEPQKRRLSFTEKQIYHNS